MNTRPMLCPPIFYKNLFVSQPFCQEILEKDTTEASVLVSEKYWSQELISTWHGWDSFVQHSRTMSASSLATCRRSWCEVAEFEAVPLAVSCRNMTFAVCSLPLTQTSRVWHWQGH